MTAELTDSNTTSRSERLIFKTILFFPCIIIFYRGLDNDIWFLLNHGRYILEKGIPHIEPFTIHHGFHFVMQQWLSSVIFWLTYSSLGEIGIRLLVLVCYMFVVYVIYKLCMKVSENNFIISYIFSLAFSLIISFVMLSRPYIFSTLLIALELFCLESYRVSNNKKYLCFLPVLSILMINFHAAMWLMLFVILIPYVIESFRFKIGPIESPGTEKLFFYSMIIVMALVGFINPYGLEAMTYLLKSYNVESINTHILEMQPASLKAPFGIVIFACILVILIIYIKCENGQKRLRYILLSAGTAYLALSAVRNVSIFALCSFFTLAYYLKDLKPKLKQQSVTQKTLRLRKILAALILILMAAAMIIAYHSSKTNNKNNELLESAINYIINNEDDKNVTLYTGYGAGGMAEFKGIPAYIDARAEIFLRENNKKSDVLNEYFRLQAGLIYYKDFISKYHFTHLLLTKDDVLYTLLKHDKDYKIVYSNEAYTIFINTKL